MIINIHKFSFQLVTLLVLCFSCTINAQDILIEKIYAQTDRTFYFPGETLWFKGYITNPEFKKSTISEVLHAELISPKGDIVANRRLKIENGYVYGEFSISQNWAGGIYKLRLFTSWMKNYGESAYFTKKITVQKVIQPKLLLALDFKKKAYGAGDTVIANFKVENLKNEPLTQLAINFNVVTKGQSIINKETKTNTEGKCDITFQLPPYLNSQDVLLNVLIPHKGSQESISRSVPVILNNIDLQFLPESGNLLANAENKLAFIAVNEFGKPADISGFITDSQGNKITQFSSFHDGMGSLNFKPNLNKNYQAFITKPFTNKKPIPIENAISKGTIIKLIEHNKTSTTFKIISNSNKEVQVKASAFGKVKYDKKHVLKSSKEAGFYEKIISINTEKYLTGIFAFTILNTNNQPLAERLVFLNKHRNLHIDINLNKDIFNTRELVSVKVKTTDNKDKPVPANLSISVADNSLISLADDKQDHILSSFLLSSELHGEIHEPIFYFDKTKEKATSALDYVMLTHGWRTWIKKPILTEENAKFPPERSGIIRGTVTDTTNTPITAKLVLFDNDSKNAVVFNTDEDGHFKFKSGENRYETYTLLAYRDDNKKLKIVDNFIFKTDDKGYTTISIDGKEAIDQANSIIRETNIKQKQKKRIKQEVEEIEPKLPGDKGISAFSLEEDNSSLDEIVVVGYGTQKTRNTTGAISKISSQNIDNSTTGFEQALQGRVAGVTVKQTEAAVGGDTKITLRGSGSTSGNSEPLLVINGLVTGTDSNLLSSIDPSIIQSVNILKDASATAIYGSRGANGVILIETQNNFYNKGKNLLYSRKLKFNYTTKTYSGAQKYFYDYGRSFYTTMYDSENITKERTDFRKTIYWNPVVQTNEKGEASFDFYNSDAITSFKITTEGLGANGFVGRDETLYSAKKILDVSFKAPNYISVGDQVIMPVTITNESNKDINGALSIKLPKEFLTNDKTQEYITIPKNGFVLKNIAFSPSKKLYKPTIEVAFNSKEYSDINRQEVDITETSFPIYSTIADRENKTFTYNLENVIPNSTSGNFISHINVLSDVTEGIDAMIRKPSGCFEQISSKTYPNILALKYLRATKQENSKTERKSLRYIKEGHNKLAGFQVKSGGFEWFGHGPGNEGLTAYGLMQFSEMKDVYDGVDDFMLKKAMNWLLSRRDSLGGFKQNMGKYGYAGAPKKVTNAYIVFALSEVDTKIDISSQYKKAFNEALLSKDTYRMVLMAIASHNYGLQDNEQKLTNEVLKNINTFGLDLLAVEETITRSYGRSKNIETNALLLSLLLKKKEKHLDQIELIAEHILRKRWHGSFGNTQATSMALKALLEYAKMNPKNNKIDTDELTFIINNDTITKQLSDRKYSRIRIDSLEKYFTKRKQKLSVQFSNPENTFPYTINSAWRSTIPDSAPDCLVNIKTVIDSSKLYKVSDNVRMKISIANTTKKGLPMTTTVIGIPSGLSVQPWQLKEITETQQIAYYEIFENYLVLYWTEMGPLEEKTINLDLKAEIAGEYTAPPSSVYLYYSDDKKHWIKGNSIKISP